MAINVYGEYGMKLLLDDRWDLSYGLVDIPKDDYGLELLVLLRKYRLAHRLNIVLLSTLILFIVVFLLITSIWLQSPLGFDNRIPWDCIGIGGAGRDGACWGHF